MGRREGKHDASSGQAAGCDEWETNLKACQAATRSSERGCPALCSCGRTPVTPPPHLHLFGLSEGNPGWNVVQQLLHALGARDDGQLHRQTAVQGLV